MSQPAGEGAPPPTLSETLVKAHERAQGAVTLFGRRIRNASGDLGRIESAASDVVVTLVETADVVLSKVMAVPSEALDLPTSLFQSCMDHAPNEAVHHEVSTLSASFASVVKLPNAAAAADKAQTAPQPGAASASPADAAQGASPGGSTPPEELSPLKAGLAGGLRTLQQVPERLNDAVTRIIEADDLTSDADAVRLPHAGSLAQIGLALTLFCALQMMRRRPVRTAQPFTSSPRKEEDGSPAGTRSPASASASPSALRRTGSGS